MAFSLLDGAFLQDEAFLLDRLDGVFLLDNSEWEGVLV